MMHMFGWPFGLFVWVLLLLLFLPAGARLARRARRRTPPRSPAAPARLEARVYRLAHRLGGRISVSDVVVDSGLSAAEAEGLLQGMSDGLRVRMEVDDRGLITYEFPEITARRAASSPG